MPLHFLAVLFFGTSHYISRILPPFLLSRALYIFRLAELYQYSERFVKPVSISETIFSSVSVYRNNLIFGKTISIWCFGVIALPDLLNSIYFVSIRML
jgi:hypothetical protein